MCLPVPKRDESTLSKGEQNGFEWQTVHNGIGYRCGYIRVLQDHPWFEDSEPDVDVHGGITFAKHGEACPTHGPIAEWWIGFDCAHGGDAPDPALPRDRRHGLMTFPGDVIRTQAYVEDECRSLCEQAAAVRTKGAP